MSLHRSATSTELETHPRIQHIRLTPLLQLVQPLLALQRSGFVVCALDIFLMPRHSRYLIVRARQRPVIFQGAFEFKPGEGKGLG